MGSAQAGSQGTVTGEAPQVTFSPLDGMHPFPSPFVFLLFVSRLRTRKAGFPEPHPGLAVTSSPPCPQPSWTDGVGSLPRDSKEALGVQRRRQGRA